MRIAKQLLMGALVVATLIGVVAWIDSASMTPAAAEEKLTGDHWRYHDGHWSMWNAADKRWYYTDGNHWFFHDGNAWRLYRFDAKFGRNAFVHGGYVAPREEIKIAAPRHEIFIIR